MFQLLFEHSADAIWLLDPQTIQFVDCNEAAVRLMRARDKGQLVGSRPKDLSPPIQPDGLESAAKASTLTALTEQQGTQRFEWTARRFDGSDVPLEVVATPIVASGRRLNVIISRDITERKVAEQEILDLNQALERRITERTAELTAREGLQRATYEISEAVHTTEDLSSLYKQIHRIISGLMPAKNFYIALLDRETQQISFAYHVDERTPWPPPMTMKTGLTSLVLRSGKPLLVGRELQGGMECIGQEIRSEALGGASYVACGVPAAVWLGVPLLRQGQPIGVLAVQDYENERAYGEGEKQILTFVAGQIALAIERKRVQAELLKTLAREKELGQLKSNFVSMVSHEFRTPLGIIQSSAEILRDYFDKLEGEERQEQLESIVKNTGRMAEMMEEVLVLSRLDAGKMEFKPEPLDFGGFCRRVVDEVLAGCERRCVIELRVEGMTGPAQADERLLEHIFNNLLSNAVKYSDPGSLVHLTVERQGTEACCVVRDQGIGIPEADQPGLFNTFQRGGNVGDRPGTGLGLVLVKRCVELHGGTVQIQSQLGQGTTVTVRLPVFPSAL